MSDLSRAMVIAALIIGGAFVVRGMFGTDRYDLVPAAAGAVYRIDRLTGSVAVCTPMLCKVLPLLVPAPDSTKRVPRAPSAVPKQESPEPPKTNT